MANAVLERQKGVSKDLGGGGSARRHITKAAPKRLAGRLKDLSDNTGLTMLDGEAAADQCHLNEVGFTKVEVGLGKSSMDSNFPGRCSSAT